MQFPIINRNMWQVKWTILQGTASSLRHSQFDHKHWPISAEQLKGYGIEGIETLAEHFKGLSSMESFSLGAAKSEWMRLKRELSTSPLMDSTFQQLWNHVSRHFHGPLDYPNICILVRLVLLLVVDTSCCERGFSSMNRIHTESRNRLKLSTLNDLMFISFHGPSVEDFQPEPIFDKWVSLSKRQASKSSQN